MTKREDFPEANALVGEPSTNPVPAFVGDVLGGRFDGSRLVVIAWKPSTKEIEQIAATGKIYIAAFGSLPNHFLTSDVNDAILNGKG